MNRTGSLLVLATLTSVAAASVAAAQLPGIPFGPVQTGLGLNISADYGKPNDDAGGGSAIGLTAGLGFSRFGLSASVGRVEPDVVTDGEIAIAGRLGMKLFGGGLNPITVGAQVGVSSVAFDLGLGDERVTQIMPGAFVRLSPPLFPLKPWGNVYYVTGSNVPDAAKEVRFAVGADFNLLLGFGVHAGYDWGNEGGSTLGVGAHFTFRVPGLGVPGVPGM